MTHAEASMKTKQAMADSLKRYMEVKSARTAELTGKRFIITLRIFMIC